MKPGDEVWTAGGVKGTVVDVATLAALGMVSVRWPWGVSASHARQVFTTAPGAPQTEVERLREEIAALRAEVRKAKVNVRDACATACAEVIVGAIVRAGSSSGLNSLGHECLDRIAALDLEAL